MTENEHIFEQIEAYLSDGLSPEERLTLETHAATCAACAQALADARQIDGQMRELFAETMPQTGFEDQIIDKLRLSRSPRRRFIHPMVLRSATGVAAAIVLAGTGFLVTESVARRHSMDRTRSPIAVGAIESDRSVQLNHRGSLFATSDLTDPKALAFYQEMKTQDLSPRMPAGETVGSSTSNGQFDTVAPPTFSLQVPNSAAGQRMGAPSTALTGSVNQGANLALGGANAYTGATTVNGGTITLNAGATIASTPPAGAGGSSEEMPAATKDSLAFKPSTELGTAGSYAYGGGGAGNGRGAGGLVANEITASPAKAAPSQPPAGAPGATNAATPAAANADVATLTARKIIRNGSLDFEIDRFDDVLVRVTKLVGEQQGFVATTDSDTLPDGRIKGTVTLRVPPDRLDTLVLMLRGIGDLKSQKITAEDVSKHYTDLESELKADRAMEERLLAIIKTANGQVKDLLEAERELGEWRQKIEAIEGEKRYLDSQIAFSTLVLGLTEKVVRVESVASESEQVSVSLETDKVEDAYSKTMTAISEAKGQIRQSELKQYDAGQFAGTIVAAVPPDAAEQVIARIRQLTGRIAHFSREQKQTTPSGQATAQDAVHVKRDDTVISLQIYNLANVAPRRTTSVAMAVAQVDKVFQQIIDQVRGAGGRVVTSNLAKPDANVLSAELDVQVPADKADAFADSLRGYGEVMRQESAESPDTADVTESKRRFRISLASLTAIQPRETQVIQLAAKSVPQAFNDILNAVKSADGRSLKSDLNQQNAQNITAEMQFEVPRTALAAVTTTMDNSGQVLTRTLNRSPDTQNTIDSKVRLSLSLMSADNLPPRQTTTIGEEVSDVEHAADDLSSAAVSAGGRRIGSGQMNQDSSGHLVSQVMVEVPLSKAGPIVDLAERSGYRRSKTVEFNANVPDGPLAVARIDVTFSNSPQSLGGEQTTWDAVRNGLSVSGRGLRWSAQLLVVGLCFVAPWVVLLWIGWKIFRRSRGKVTTKAAVA